MKRCSACNKRHADSQTRCLWDGGELIQHELDRPKIDLGKKFKPFIKCNLYELLTAFIYVVTAYVYLSEGSVARLIEKWFVILNPVIVVFGMAGGLVTIIAYFVLGPIKWYYIGKIIRRITNSKPIQNIVNKIPKKIWVGHLTIYSTLVISMMYKAISDHLTYGDGTIGIVQIIYAILFSLIVGLIFGIPLIAFLQFIYAIPLTLRLIKEGDEKKIRENRLQIIVTFAAGIVVLILFMWFASMVGIN
jgi:hypothetical protein